MGRKNASCDPTQALGWDAFLIWNIGHESCNSPTADVTKVNVLSGDDKLVSGVEGGENEGERSRHETREYDGF